MTNGADPTGIGVAEFLCSTISDRINDRRSYEFRIAFAYWVGYGLAAEFVVTHGHDLSLDALATGWRWLLSVVVSIPFVLHMAYVFGYVRPAMDSDGSVRSHSKPTCSATSLRRSHANHTAEHGCPVFFRSR